jgi:hypothetical protein
MIPRCHLEKAPVIHALAVYAFGSFGVSSFKPIQVSLEPALGIGLAQADSSNTAPSAGINNSGASTLGHPTMDPIKIKRPIIAQ